ncbi:MAG: tetratricopeptide repeat protein [Bradymonadaceae bacterium]|nr:tetratricopeptide repeat protein [Lujinxingiaceae bacterium]
MAIKIKKKSGASQAESVTDADGEVVGPDLSVNFPTEDADAFEAATIKTAVWVEDNRNTVIGGFVAIVLAAIGVFAGVQYVQSSQVTASTSLSQALASYEVLVEGSAELEQIKASEDIKAPTVTFESEQIKWQTIYDQSTATLAEHNSGAIASTAQLTKAAAAFNLGKFDEAITLYSGYVNDPSSKDIKPFAYFGLANSYAAKGEVDKAIAELDKFAGASPDQTALVKYEKARLLERSGKGDDAKKIYHDILETEPESAFRGDIERRLATL